MANLAVIPSGSARLALCDRAPTRDGIDGAWWPRNADVGAELADVVSLFGLWIGSVRRVVYDPRNGWLQPPVRVASGNSTATVDPYRLRDPRALYMVGTHARDAVLFVVPPAVSAVSGKRLLRVVGAAAGPLSTGAVGQLLEDLTTQEQITA